MDFVFQSIEYDKERFLEDDLPLIPKRSGVYRVFDTRGKLTVLDRTSNLHLRMERFFGVRSELLRDLDLRTVAGRIEFRPTDSSFETLYLLYLERRVAFPRTYRRMKTFRSFLLMKFNRKQRFPRVYATRQIKAGVDYFGPFVSRGQFARLKTTLERTFKLRPCPFNIRGNDPHADCLYFQMHSCSRPCNNDIGRSEYLCEVEHAIRFVQGKDEPIERGLLDQINGLAAGMRFEEAEIVRRRLEKIRKARSENRETFESLWDLRCVILLASNSAARRKIAFVREGSIVELEDYDVETLPDRLARDAERCFNKPLEIGSREWQYDEFCLVSTFIIGPQLSVDVIPVDRAEEVAARVMERIQQKKRKRKNTHVDTVA